MATMNPASAGRTVSTVAADTIESAFREIMDDEAKHVSFFEAALKKAGAPVPPKPTFRGLEQSNQSDFIAMSGILENTGVATFLMALPAIKDKKYVAAAESIVTIEARHAGFFNALLGVHREPQRRAGSRGRAGQRHGDPQLRPSARTPRGGVLSHQRSTPLQGIAVAVSGHGVDRQPRGRGLDTWR